MSLDLLLQKLLVDDPNPSRVRFKENPVFVTGGVNDEVFPAMRFVRAAVDKALVGDTSVQTIGAAANDALSVTAATLYFFDAFLYITGGTTSHTIAFTLKGGGTATVTSVLYKAEHVSGTAEAVTSNDIDFTLVDSDDGTGVVVTPAITAGASHIWIEGEFAVNAAGTIIPSIKLSADPQGDEVLKLGSRVRIYPVGSSTVSNVGEWA